MGNPIILRFQLPRLVPLGGSLTKKTSSGEKGDTVGKRQSVRDGGDENDASTREGTARVLLILLQHALVQTCYGKPTLVYAAYQPSHPQQIDDSQQHNDGVDYHLDARIDWQEAINQIDC
jgi:hypothetical protein